MPEFYYKDTRKWFDLAEQFLADGESDQVEKNSILRVIPTEVQTESGIDVTRNRIIVHCDDSNDQKLRKLLGKLSLGDQQPSVALRKFQQLGQGNENLVRLRLAEMMPTPIKVVLAALDSCSVEKLAEAADNAEQLPQPAKFHSVGPSTDPTPHELQFIKHPDELSMLKAQIAELNTAVPAIGVGYRGNDRGRNRYRQSRNRDPFRPENRWNRQNSRSASNNENRSRPSGRKYSFS